MNTEQYLEKMRDVQDTLIELIEGEELCVEHIIQLFDNKDILNNRNEFKVFLHLLSKISKNHHRTPNFFTNLDKLLSYLKKDIQNYFPNWEIFTIFKNNIRILLYLIKEKILTIDDFVSKELTKDKYYRFFFPEVKPFLERRKIIEFSGYFNKYYETKRMNAENDSYICEIIRKDSVEEFVTYTVQTNLTLSTAIIKPSVFETNSFLIKQKKISLIEYTAFFGAIQIFQYLQNNNVKLTSSLWPFAIHGKNADIIHILEQNKINPPDNDFKFCFFESIKCHHNNIANYIEANLLQEVENNNLISLSIKNHNYGLIQKEFVNQSYLKDLCLYDHITLVKILNDSPKININSAYVFEYFFYPILNTKKFFYETPLYAAVEKDNIEIVQILLENAKIDPNVGIKSHLVRNTYNRSTALYRAVEKQNIEIIQLLLNNKKTNPNIKNLVLKELLFMIFKDKKYFYDILI